MTLISIWLLSGVVSLLIVSDESSFDVDQPEKSKDARRRQRREHGPQRRWQTQALDEFNDAARRAARRDGVT